MNLQGNNSDDIKVITLLSNGSERFYPDTSLTSFSDILHKRLDLDPLKYHYVALQEIVINLNSLNVRVRKINRP